MHTSDPQSKATRPFSCDTRIGGPVGSSGDAEGTAGIEGGDGGDVTEPRAEEVFVPEVQATRRSTQAAASLRSLSVTGRRPIADSRTPDASSGFHPPPDPAGDGRPSKVSRPPSCRSMFR